MRFRNIYESWGKTKSQNKTIKILERQDFNLGSLDTSFLPFGNGRSYGDLCINSLGTLLDTQNLNQFIEFNQEQGYIKAYSGVLLAEILELITPHNWFLPVVPGTKYITLGGAIASDIHGKNHHRFGTFGLHVEEFEVLKSNGERLLCSPASNSHLYRATIGGMGLTGLIIWAKIKLKKITNNFLDMELVKFSSLNEFLCLSKNADENFEYTVAWIDSGSHKSSSLKGIFMQANHNTTKLASGIKIQEFKLPNLIPFNLVNSYNTKIFNFLYYNKQLTKKTKTLINYNNFFFPLDLVSNWNILYGPKGFIQLQFVCPEAKIKIVIDEVLILLDRYDLRSPISVLKIFGNIQSPGLLSFPKPGITLAIDLPLIKNKTNIFLDEALKLIEENDGSIYPAKDTQMNQSFFKKSYSQVCEFKQFIDPKFSSDFWRRVND